MCSDLSAIRFLSKPENFFLSGDDLTSTSPPSYALIKLFQLEHNRLVDAFKMQHPQWEAKTLYEEARRMVSNRDKGHHSLVDR